MTTDVATKACQHHWVLSEPENGVIRGTCKFCRSTKDYPARLIDDEYSDRFEEIESDDRQFMASLVARVQESL